MLLRRITIITSVLFLFAACTDSSDQNRELKDYISAYLNGNENAVAFGNAKLTTILSKSDYQKVAMLKAIVGGQVSTFEPMIDISGPVYYVANGPLNKDGAPEETILFVKVKDQELLKTHLESQMGYDMNEGDGFTYTSDGDMALGIRNNLAIIIIKGGNYDEKQELTEAFAKVDGDVSTGKIAEILASDEGDAVLAMNVSNLTSSSTGEMKRLPEAKQKELKKLFENAFVTTTFKFENGKAIIEMKNHFGKELQNKMFFNEDKSAKMLKNLGGGTPRLGFSINMDVNKMESFIEEISPGGMNEIGGSSYTMLKMMTGSSKMGQMVDGKLALLMFGEPDESGAFEPEMNAYCGLREKGKKALELAQSSYGDASSFGIPELNVSDDGVSICTNAANSNGKLVMPKGAEGFGKSGISFFINLDGLNPEDIAEMFDLDDFAPALKVAKFISFEYTNDGGKLTITAKDGKENILKQAMEIAVDDLSSQMSGVSF
ncbi:MAG: hypothetical protein ACI837_000982 [Crocinitomicaceae bacterium]|jgi:hypothetical protein